MHYITLGEIKNIPCKYCIKILHFVVDKIQNIWCSVKVTHKQYQVYQYLTSSTALLMKQKLPLCSTVYFLVHSLVEI